jgi:ATP-dependent DNA helicase DinG
MGAEVFEPAMRAMGLEPRPQQVQLVEYIRQTMTSGGIKLVQAGTGTGKSYAVLTTALEAARKTKKPSIVVCPNNALIDQYVGKDAPKIKATTGGDFVYVKGRSRYLCAESYAMQKEIGSTHARDEYLRLTANGKVEWADHGLDASWGCPGAGDCDTNSAWVQDVNCLVHSPSHKAGCTNFVAEDAAKCECRSINSKPPKIVCSCRYYCGAFEARRMAMTADVVITNAHVLVWDYLIRQYTGGQVGLLPEPGALFVDECHELEAVGRACQSDEIKPGSKVYEVVDGLREWVDAVSLTMLSSTPQQTEGLLGRTDDIKTMAKSAEVLAAELLDRADMAGQDPAAAKAYRKEAKLLTRFVDFVAESEQHISTIEIQHPIPTHDDPVTHLRRVCVDTSYLFRDILTEQPSVLVSGTIPASESRRLGIADLAKIQDVGHPFDYSQSRLVISNHRGNDRDSGYQRSVQVAKAINSTGGGALILFTSWGDLEQFTPMIVSNLDPHIRREVYIQSKEDPASLKQDIEDFRADGNAVLVGVRSLWTGLDVPGDALRCVCIWRLPYGVPTLEVKAIEKTHGKQTYFDDMLKVLTQGVGRLVRSTSDKGIVFIADSRAKGQRWRENGMTKHLAEFSS